MQLDWTATATPGVTLAKVAKPWRTAEATPGRDTASLVVAEKLLSDEVLSAARSEIARLSFDRDADSVDSCPTFEVSWVREGKYHHAGLARVFRRTIEEKLTPLLQAMPDLHGLADGDGLVLCDALVRTYDEGQRRVHPAHYDSQAKVTAVLEIDMGCGGFSGPGFYVQPDAHVSSRQAVTLTAGDVCAHSFDLQHGVEVSSGRRCSVVLWYVDSAASCANGQRPWYDAAAAAGDADAQYSLACHLLADDAARARKLMRAAAVQGHFMAQNALGVLLMHAEMEARKVGDHAGLVGSYGGAGEELYESAVYLEAERWIRASADRGYHQAMVNLHTRRMLQGGRAAEALGWLSQAAEQRADPATMHTLAAAHREGDNGCESPDLATARLWFEEAANLGHPPSQLEMGRLGGPDVERWLLLASEHGVGEASATLALRFVRQGEAAKLVELLGRCWGRLWHGSSKRGAAALPNIPLMAGV